MVVSSRVDGILVGHWTDVVAATGCTVVITPPGTVGSAFIAGGATATRETELLRPGMRNHEVHAILLTGGSAFGLEAAAGVMRFLEERGIGVQTPVAPVPIVPAAAIFDLWPGDASRRPGAVEGYAAASSASAGPVPEGSIGAGTGATVGKRAGPNVAMKGGVGWASASVDALVVECVAVVNAFGDVVDEDATVLAGARAPLGEPVEPHPTTPPSTTLCCVATNAALSKEDLARVARMASAGLARAVRPVFTMFDGDVVFALGTGACRAGVDVVGSLAADATAHAVRRGVLLATSIDGVPAYSDRAGRGI